MDGLSPFSHLYEDHEIRVKLINNEAVFSVQDVCKVLRIDNPRQVAARLDKDDVIKTDAIDSMGRSQTTWWCFEPGLYDLIFRSNKAEAIEFKRWIRKVLLPQIRKAGSVKNYIDQYVLPDPRPWEKTFDDRIKMHCKRLGLVYSHTINKYFYDRFPDGVADTIRKRNPIIYAGRLRPSRAKKNHQFLTEQVGLPELMYRMGTTLGIMSAAKDKQELEMLDRMINGGPKVIGT